MTTHPDRIPVKTDKAPGAIGPYNQAIVAGGFVHCSGQVAFDPASGEIVQGDVRVQTQRVMENLAAVL
ncbi:MAG: Rid family hydrolase, partial [Planctomycetota bacterium]